MDKPKFKYHFGFYVLSKCLRKCHYDIVYMPGDTREVVSHLGANSEIEARRQIIHEELEWGWQVVTIRLEYQTSVEEEV